MISSKKTEHQEPEWFSRGNILRVLGVALAYFIAARCGLLLAFGNSNATPVWPPSGIAFAALLLLGYRSWPGIALGAFAVNLYVFLTNEACGTETAIWVSAMIAAGNTLEAALGFRMLGRSNEPYPEKASWVYRFVVSALVMCLASAAIGPLAVSFGSISPWSNYGTVLLTWWTGDVAGVLVFAPLLLVWAKTPSWTGGWQRAGEGLCLLTGLLLVCGSIFGGWFNESSELPLSYFVIPFLLWAALRFRTHGVTLATVLWVVIAVQGTATGNGPFFSNDLNISLLSLQGYVSIISVTFLTLAASMEEHRRDSEALREARNEMVTLIQQRTTELVTSRSEIKDYQDRIEDIQEVLLKNTILDFSRRARLSGTGDELDAIAAGLNTMSEELEDHIRRIRDSEERFRVLVGNVKDYAIYTLDKDGYITSWNKGAELIKGYTEIEILGKHISHFYTEEDTLSGVPFNNLRRARERGRFEDEGWRKRKDGSLFWADIVITSMHDEQGKLRGFVKVTRDVTESKESREKILNLNHELEQNVAMLQDVNKELEAFTYSVSHDLRAPLRAIHGYTRLLAEDLKDGDSEKKRMMEAVMRNARKMGKLIDDLLSLSRMGRKELQRSHVDMNLLSSNVLQEIKTTQPANATKINVQSLPPAEADYSLISQVMSNLVDNAIKYSSKNSIPQVEIGSFREEGDVVYFVRDNGVGFDMKYYDKLFGVFQRLHSSEDFDGTGVGLALVKRIIAKHGGRVWARAENGKGATFFFTLRSRTKNENARSRSIAG